MNLKTVDFLTNTQVFIESEKYNTFLECKFILISSDTTNYLVFGALHTYNYHAQLLEQFCLESSIQSEWKKKPDQYKILDNLYHMKGGGWFRFDFERKILTVMGMSTAYGRFDEYILSEFVKEHQILKDFDVKISSK